MYIEIIIEIFRTTKAFIILAKYILPIIKTQIIIYVFTYIVNPSTKNLSDYIFCGSNLVTQLVHLFLQLLVYQTMTIKSDKILIVVQSKRFGIFLRTSLYKMYFFG